MSYKKYILEKYIISMQNVRPISNEIEMLKDIMFDIISEKKRLELQNSLLIYHKIKLIKEKQILEDKLQKLLQVKNQLKKKINYNQIHWDIYEELEFNDWLYDKEHNKNDKNDKNDKNHKRKLHDEMSIDKSKSYEDHQCKKQKHDENDENDEITVIYDSDETETDDELYSISFTKSKFLKKLN